MLLLWSKCFKHSDLTYHHTVKVRILIYWLFRTVNCITLLSFVLNVPFVCLFDVLLENISLSWIRHYQQWKATKFDLYSALKAIEKWGFFIVPHQLWKVPILYTGYLWRPVTPIKHLLSSVLMWSYH